MDIDDIGNAFHVGWLRYGCHGKLAGWLYVLECIGSIFVEQKSPDR